MAAGVIRYDSHAGKLRSDLVWRLGDAGTPLFDRNCIYAHIARSNGHYLKQCPTDKYHDTGYELTEIVIDLFGDKDDKLADFVPCAFYRIVSSAFAERLKKSGLTGFTCRPIVKVGENQSQEKDPKLLLLDIGNSNCNLSQRFTIEGGPNRCPHCGNTTMVCPSCGFTNWPVCIRCEKWTIYKKDISISHPNGFQLVGFPPDTAIVEGKQWDGRDFIRTHGGDCVSKRAKDWLERTHAHPVFFEPAFLNIEGVEYKFMKDASPKRR